MKCEVFRERSSHKGSLSLMRIANKITINTINNSALFVVQLEWFIKLIPCDMDVRMAHEDGDESAHNEQKPNKQIVQTALVVDCPLLSISNRMRWQKNTNKNDDINFANFKYVTFAMWRFIYVVQIDARGDGWVWLSWMAEAMAARGEAVQSLTISRHRLHEATISTVIMLWYRINRFW